MVGAIERLTRNAFRVLGLPATASQAAIDQAARRMRIFSDPKRVPATPFDAPWLGELPRSKMDLEQAVARLSEPRSRLRERLLWFHDAELVPADAAPAALDAAAVRFGSRSDVVAEHDTAVTLYAAALLADPRIADASRWQ